MCFFLTSAGRGDRESGGSRRTLKLAVLGEVEVEDYVNGLSSPVGGEGGIFSMPSRARMAESSMERLPKEERGENFLRCRREGW